MKSFLAAVKVLVDSGDGLSGTLHTAIGGRFYLDAAPPKATVPYVVFAILPGASRVESMGAGKLAGRSIPVSISVYSKSQSSSDALEIGDLVEELFTDAALEFPEADWKCRRAKEIGGPTVHRETPYWVWDAQWEFLLARVY